MQASIELQFACSASAVVMRKRLRVRQRASIDVGGWLRKALALLLAAVVGCGIMADQIQA